MLTPVGWRKFYGKKVFFAKVDLAIRKFI